MFTHALTAAAVTWSATSRRASAWASSNAWGWDEVTVIAPRLTSAWTRGTVISDRAPRRRHTSRSTWGSASVSSQTWAALPSGPRHGWSGSAPAGREREAGQVPAVARWARPSPSTTSTTARSAPQRAWARATARQAMASRLAPRSRTSCWKEARSRTCGTTDARPTRHRTSGAAPGTRRGRLDSMIRAQASMRTRPAQPVLGDACLRTAQKCHEAVARLVRLF